MYCIDSNVAMSSLSLEESHCFNEKKEKDTKDEVRDEERTKESSKSTGEEEQKQK
jgi:hypothetical protein